MGVCLLQAAVNDDVCWPEYLLFDNPLVLGDALADFLVDLLLLKQGLFCQSLTQFLKWVRFYVYAIACYFLSEVGKTNWVHLEKRDLVGGDYAENLTLSCAVVLVC